MSETEIQEQMYRDLVAENKAISAMLKDAEAERDKYKDALKQIRIATGAIPKDWQKFALLELNGRIFDTAHEALNDYVEGIGK